MRFKKQEQGAFALKNKRPLKKIRISRVGSSVEKYWQHDAKTFKKISFIHLNLPCFCNIFSKSSVLIS